MAETDPRAQLRSLDRWSSRRRRLIEFLCQNGIGGLIGRMREAGVTGTAAFGKRQFRYHLSSFLGSQWDREFGVETSGQIDLLDVEVVGLNKDGGYSSVSTSPSAYAFLARFFPADWKRFTFVDIGSGKGRVLVLAAMQGFDTIMGIEFAPLISQIARQNLVHISQVKRFKWSILNADATTVDLPSDVPLLIYCFNPFKAEIWEKFILVLLKARDANKNPVCLILSGTIPETLSDAAAVITRSARFKERAQGVTPFFMDAYAPYHYRIFDSI
jgi:hypothetical protein